MLVSAVHPVTVRSAAFCTVCSLVEGMLAVKFVLLNGVCFISLGVGGRRVSKWRGWCWYCALCRSIDECSLQC